TLYDEQSPVNPWGGDLSRHSETSDAVQRDFDSASTHEMPTLPTAPDVSSYDAGYEDMGDQPVDLHQAMMGAGLVPPDADAGWDGDDGSLSPGFIQRAPDAQSADANAYTPQQPVDVFQAMMQAGMVQPAPDDNLDDGYYPSDT